jgi:23S rRNA (adenine2503-C2)-methyltransferase
MSFSVSIYDLDQPQLAEILAAWGESAYRAKQIWQGLYHQLWASASEFTSLPQALRHKLAEAFSFAHLQPATVLQSSDGKTRKTLFRLPDHQPVEAVLMRYARRQTLCISTQAGCAMGCVFCATGQMGFRRNLTSGEIVEQVLYYARMLRAEGKEVTNVVVMGMGEPFHNYEATLAAIDRLNNREGFNLGARRFTISTVGLIPAIRRFTAEHRQINLAVSLHAADDELRSSLLPINRKYPLDELFIACREYVQQTGRRISFEWALIQDVNDTTEQARRLAERLQGLHHGASYLCHVNVIPLNPTHRYNDRCASTFRASTHQQAEAFQAELRRHGIPCSIRLRRGVDIQAGCGQLGADFGRRLAG